MSLMLLLSSRFSPQDIGGLGAWYDFSDHATVTLSTTFITQVLDKSGNGLTVTASGTKRPTYAGTQNGLSVATFATDDGLTISGTVPSNVIAAPQATTMFFVQKKTGTGAATTLYYTRASQIINMNYDWSDGNVYADFVSGSTGRVSGAAPSGFRDAWHIVDYQKVSATTANTRVDNVEIATTSSQTNAALTQDVTDASLYIGHANSSSYFNGDIAEVLIYNRALSALERSMVYAYLKDKWGL